MPHLRILLSLALGLLLSVSSGAAWAKAAAGPVAPQRLSVPDSPDAYFYRASGKGLKPVLVYLHGRGGNPAEDCRKWAKVGTQFGWVLCPQGIEDRGGGSRSWANDVGSAERIVQKSIAALRAKYKGRVQTRNNILIGFSEGAFIAMQMGIKSPAAFSRWLILAANDSYWFGETPAKIEQHRRQLKRVFLLTGESDGVAENTKRVGSILKRAKIPVRVKIQPGMGHEIPAERMVTNYRRALMWLASAK